MTIISNPNIHYLELWSFILQPQTIPPSSPYEAQRTCEGYWPFMAIAFIHNIWERFYGIITNSECKHCKDHCLLLWNERRITGNLMREEGHANDWEQYFIRINNVLRINSSIPQTLLQVYCSKWSCTKELSAHGVFIGCIESRVKHKHNLRSATAQL